MINDRRSGRVLACFLDNAQEDCKKLLAVIDGLLQVEWGDTLQDVFNESLNFGPGPYLDLPDGDGSIREVLAKIDQRVLKEYLESQKKPQTSQETPPAGP